MNNALRHARARTVTVHLRRDDGGVTLEVLDDGRGFDPGTVPPGGLGLRSMRDRAAQMGGTLEIRSAVGGGTRELATLDLPQERA